jgi:hypothetical protein
MDLGCYCVHMARTIVGGDPRVVSVAAVEGVRRLYRLRAGTPAMNPDLLRQPGQQSPSEGYCPGDGLLVQDSEVQRRVPEGQMVLECPCQPRLVDDHASRRYDVRADGAAWPAASSAMPIEPVPATMPMPGTGLATRRS